MSKSTIEWNDFGKLKSANELTEYLQREYEHGGYYHYYPYYPGGGGGPQHPGQQGQERSGPETGGPSAAGRDPVLRSGGQLIC